MTHQTLMLRSEKNNAEQNALGFTKKKKNNQNEV